ncbi:MAG: NADH-quinone oxidoreductase subunit NuoG [Moraxella sp.]|nr:NADH-quinone oxidoreductase subunit NuoG [Moraxella sp.]
MAVIHVDGKSFEVDSADNLLQACLSLGIDVPYFCYHPALGSVGSCRQCAVKQYNNEEDYKAGRGRLVMSCMVAPTNDMYISVDDQEAKDFRRRIVEYIMTNHPHDCPTCEEGGHCHLQDMTYMSGHRQRRYRFTKRTHHNQDLGAFINHEMNRCIACYRCVRFYKDYAGGTDLGVYASNNRVYFGRDSDGQFESEFSGNLTEVCPTGVFTDKTHSDRYNRKWDMQYAPSVCHGCSSGCNISVGERYGEIRRIENRYNHDVNGYFLCDRGRFGYGYVNRGDRPSQPLENIHGKLIKVNADFALDGVAALLKNDLAQGKVIGIGSVMSSLENNFALKRLVGADNYSTGMSVSEQRLCHEAVQLLRQDDVHNVSLSEIEQADTVLILGEDITQTAARVALSVRQAAKNKAKQMATALRTDHWLAEPVKRIGQNAYSPIYNIAITDTKLDDVSKISVVANAGDSARLGYMVGEAIAKMPDVWADIVCLGERIFDKPADDELSLAKQIAYDLLTADKPLLITGTSLGDDNIIKACGYIAKTLAKKRAMFDKDGYHKLAGLYTCMPYANSVGLSLLGGLNLEQALQRIDGGVNTVLVMEHDLADTLTPSQLDKVLAKTVIVLDSQTYPWHDKAAYVLSTGSFAESDGTLISAEGRVQRFFAAYDKQYYEPHSIIKEAWRWLYAIDNTLKNEQSTVRLDEVIAELGVAYPIFETVKDAAPLSDYRITGLKVAREPRRYSGRTAIRAPLSIHEPMQPKDVDTALTFSMEGYVGEQTNPASIPFAWSAGWNSPQAWNKLQDKVGGKLKGGDVGVRLFDILPRMSDEYPNQLHDIKDGTPTSIFNETVSLVAVPTLIAGSKISNRSAVINAQNAAPAWLINAQDVARWHLKAGDKLAVYADDVQIVLPVQVVEYLADGCVGYPAGQVPSYIQSMRRIKKVDDSVPVYHDEVLMADTHSTNVLFAPTDTAKEL